MPDKRLLSILCLACFGCDKPFLNSLPTPLPGEDTLPPTIDWISPVDGDTVSGTITWRVDVEDIASNVGSVEFRAADSNVDTLLSAPYEINLDTAAFPDGPLTLEVVATDSSPKANKSRQSVTITCTNYPPAFSNVVVSPSAAGSGATVTIAFDASEPLQGNPTVSVGTAAAVLTSQTGAHFEYAYTVMGTEAEGDTTISITGTDAVGLTTTDQTASVNLDFTAPTVLVVLPEDASTGTHVPETFSIAAGVDDGVNGAGVSTCMVCAASDGACDDEWTAGVINGGTCEASGITCTDGDVLTINVSAEDETGNVAMGTAVQRTCDGSPPTFGGPVVATNASSSHVGGSFELSVPASDAAGLVTCQVCRTTDGACDAEIEWTDVTWTMGDCAASLTCTNNQALTVAFRVRDVFGNGWSSTTALNRTCDTVPPSATSFDVTDGATATHVPSGFGLSAPFGDTGAGLSACEMCVATDGTCDDEWTSATLAASTCTATGLVCTHGDILTLRMRGTDGAGNVTTTAPLIRTCDAQAPTASTLTITGGDNGTHISDSFGLETDVTDATTSIASCQSCVATDGTCDDEWVSALLNTGTCSATLSCTDGESVVVGLRAFDEVGNVIERVESRLCDGLGPTVGSLTTSNQATDTHVAASFELSATFDDGAGSGLASCAVCSTTGGTCVTGFVAATLSGGQCTASLSCSDGENLTLAMRATDEMGNVSDTSEISRICDDAPPSAGAVTPSNQATSTHIAGTFDVATTFSDAAGLTSCEVCQATDGSCDAGDWSTATVSGSTCTATSLTCSDGDTVTLNMRAQDVFGTGYGTATAITRSCDVAAPTEATPPTTDSTGSTTHVDANYSVTATFSDAVALGTCEVCVTTDGACDSPGEWSSASVSGNQCSATPPACTQGQPLTIAMRADDVFSNGWGTTSEIDRSCDTTGPVAGSVVVANTDDGTYVDGTFDVSTTFVDGDSGVTACEICVATESGCGPSDWTAALWSTGTCEATDVACTNGDNLIISMAATDAVGNRIEASAIGRTCDALAPAAGPMTVFNQATGTHVAGSFDVAQTFVDASGIVLCEVCAANDFSCDPGDWITATVNGNTCEATGLTCTGLDNLVIAMRARDSVDNAWGTGATAIRGCDTAPPTASTVTPQPPATPNYVGDQFELVTEFSDAAGVAYCEFCMTTDGACDSPGEWSLATLSGTTCSVTTPSCTDGQLYTLNMRADDVFSNGFGAGSEIDRTCDRTPPSSVTLSRSSNTIAALDLTWTVATDDGAGMGSYEIYYDGDLSGPPYNGTGAVEGASPFPTVATTANVTGLGPCDTYFAAVSAVDAVGNVGAYSNEIAFRSECGPDGTFSQGNFYSLGSIRGMTTGDFDADGIFDLALVESTGNALYVAFGAGTGGRGDGTFEPTMNSYGIAMPVYDVVTDDFDADGILDLAISIPSMDNVFIMLGTGSDGKGDGGFLSPDVSTATSARNLLTGDFNEDGIVDIVMGNDNGIGVMLGNGTGGRGDGTFPSATTYSASLTLTRGLATGDFNSDGITDVAVGDVGVGAASGKVVIFTGDGSDGVGDGTFTIGEIHTFGQNDDSFSIATGDFNTDGITDLAVTLMLGSRVQTLVGDGSGGRGDGTFTLGLSIPVFGPPRGIVAGDFNGDAVTDLAFAGGSSSTQSVGIMLGLGSEGRGSGAFAPTVIYPAGSAAEQLVAVDQDENGITDLIVGVPGNSWFRVLLGGGYGATPGGTFEGGVLFTGNAREGIATGDFDTDGIIDVISSELNQELVLLGGGVDGRGDGLLSTAQPFGAADVVRGGATGDFNSDGILDVVAASPSTNAIYVYLGNGSNGRGDGTFGTGTPYSASGATSAGMVVADFDEDAILDVATAGAGEIFIFLGNGGSGVGNGTFANGVSYATTCSAPGDLVAGDFNRDGILDLAQAGICVLQGDGSDGRGDGTFATSVEYTVPGSRGLRTADLDADGILDLVSTHVDTTSGIAVLLGNGSGGRGNGTFGAYTTYDHGTDPVSLTLADYNGDAIQDVAVSYASSFEVAVFTGMGSNGRGNGSFGSASTLSPSYPMGSTTTADFDEDGILDIATAAFGWGVIIHYGEGTHE